MRGPCKSSRPTSAKLQRSKACKRRKRKKSKKCSKARSRRHSRQDKSQKRSTLLQVAWRARRALLGRLPSIRKATYGSMRKSSRMKAHVISATLLRPISKIWTIDSFMSMRSQIFSVPLTTNTDYTLSTS